MFFLTLCGYFLRFLATQTKTQTVDTMTQTDDGNCIHDWTRDDSTDDDGMTVYGEDCDSDYGLPDDVDMPTDSDLESDDHCCEDENPSLHKQAKYIVFWQCLLTLVAMCCCSGCGSKRLSKRKREVGTLVVLTLTCSDCGKRQLWHSQPYIGNVAAGNILLSAATLFAGATIGKVLRVLSHMGVRAITARTFFRHQVSMLHTTITRVWTSRQQWMFASLQADGDDLVCGGDGRADSPGHCAKYGTYTMMDLNHRAVIDVQLVQVVT